MPARRWVGWQPNRSGVAAVWVWRAGRLTEEEGDKAVGGGGDIGMGVRKRGIEQGPDRELQPGRIVTG